LAAPLLVDWEVRQRMTSGLTWADQWLVGMAERSAGPLLRPAERKSGQGWLRLPAVLGVMGFPGALIAHPNLGEAAEFRRPDGTASAGRR
jgi:hypothetical protein